MINCNLINDCKVSKKNKKETLIDRGAKSKSKCLIENANEKEYIVIEFENCVYKSIQNEMKKCDYGIETENEIFYIELKGSDNNQGLKQLLSTVENTKDCFKINGTNKLKELNSILVVSQKEKPENLDKITFKKLSKLIGKIPIIEKESRTIHI